MERVGCREGVKILYFDTFCVIKILTNFFARQWGGVLTPPNPLLLVTPPVFVITADRATLAVPHWHWHLTVFISAVCGGDVQRDHGILSSPNYPEYYKPSKECVWKITVPDGFTAALKFQSFEVGSTRLPFSLSTSCFRLSVCLSVCLSQPYSGVLWL